jgi:parallel beta-helix repeat protein
VSCGDTITTDTTLDSDLVDCPNAGIVIGADDITLDLNGHTIDGIGGDVGVSLFDNDGVTHEGITVKNGSIRQFEEGLQAIGTRDIRLFGLATSQNHFGINVAAAVRVLIRDCSANHSGREGVGLLLSEASGPGIEHDGSARHVRVVNSSFRHNGDGIRSLGTKDSVIKGNLISDNRATGIDWDWGSSRDRLIRNRIVRNETGVVVNGDRNVIAGNRVSHSRRDGVSIVEGRGNVLARNVIAGAATGIEIHGEFEPGRGGAMHTVIRGNRLRQADHDGLLVKVTAEHTLLRHNSARRSEDDGFDVNDPTTKLSRNRAVRNGDLGIEAVRRVNDAGGNTARHNGDRRQCRHVACK